MIEKIKAKHKLDKWYYFIPIIGTIIYSVIIEYAINKLVIEQGLKQYKVVKKYKTIFALISLAIAIAFMIVFFVLRNRHGFGSYPWFFWVGLGFGLSQNLVPVIPWFLYKKGINKFEINSRESKEKEIEENEDAIKKPNDEI